MDTHYRDIEPTPLQVACSHCALNKRCFPHDLPSAFQTLFPLVDEKRIRLGRGEYLFHAHDPQIGIYAVKAGFLKISIPLPDGQSKIVGFHAMGDVLGLESLGGGQHRSDAIALNGCEVCVIPLDKFEKLLEHPTESAHVRQLLARHRFCSGDCRLADLRTGTDAPAVFRSIPIPTLQPAATR